MPSRILVVDDEPRNCRLLASCLAPLGHDITIVESGAEALEALARGGIDIVLLDVAMPTMDGLTVLRTLRANEAQRTAVILVTAHAARDIRLEGMEAGADEFLEKPIDRALLLTRVTALLNMQAMQNELRARHAALERLQRERLELTQFLVHDFKNPIGVVAANVDFVKAMLPSASGELHEALDDARSAAMQLNAMATDLLTIAQLEQNQVRLRLERFNVGALIHEVTRARTHSAESRRLSVVIDADDVELSADRSLVRRVVENLADNAFRYADSGGSVGFSCRRGESVEIGVANTGSRIAPEMRERIFEKFFRGEQSGGGNFGLGLTFCKQVIAAHGGQITVRDTPEWATCFTVTLPGDGRC